MLASNQVFQKKANIALVLQTIHRYKEISRVEVASRLGLKKSTVSNIVSELLNYGVIDVM